MHTSDKEENPSSRQALSSPDSTNNEQTSPTHSKWPLFLTSLENPQYRWLFFGNFAFFFAMQGQILTRSFLAWELTHSELSLATINLVVAIPILVASVIGGAITDRVERRQLVIIGQSLIVCNEVFVLTLLLTNQLEYWHLLCTVFVAGCAFPFITPARMALVYNTVGPAKLGNAMALSAGGMNLARVLGPATMGIVINYYEIKGAYVLSILLYLIAVLSMFAVSKNRAPQSTRKPLLSEIKYGFEYVANNRAVLMCLIFGLIPMFLAMPFQNLLVVFSDEVWHVGERGFGIMMAATGIGGVIGSIWIARRGENPKRLRLMIISALLFAIFLGMFCMTNHFYLALIPLLVANIFANACQTLNNTSVQLLIDDAVRGRVSSFMMMSFGLTPLGVLPMAMAAEKIGAPYAVLGACAGLLISVLIFYLVSPTLRNLDFSVQQTLKH